MSQPETLAIAMPPEHRNFVLAESDRICRAALTTLRRKLERDQLDQELSVGNVADGDDDEPLEKESNDDHKNAKVDLSAMQKRDHVSK